MELQELAEGLEHLNSNNRRNIQQIIPKLSTLHLEQRFRQANRMTRPLPIPPVLAQQIDKGKKKARSPSTTPAIAIKKPNPRRCFLCGSKNHIKQLCPKYQCYHCNKQASGHITYKCPIKQNQMIKE